MALYRNSRRCFVTGAVKCCEKYSPPAMTDIHAEANSTVSYLRDHRTKTFPTLKIKRNIPLSLGRNLFISFIYFQLSTFNFQLSTFNFEATPIITDMGNASKFASIAMDAIYFDAFIVKPCGHGEAECKFEKNRVTAAGNMIGLNGSSQHLRRFRQYLPPSNTKESPTLCN